MNERDAFLGWFNTEWRAAERALHDGDAAPRCQTWSDREPVTLFGAWLNANGPAEVREVFSRLADSFSRATSSAVELVAADVSGDLAHTAHREITSTVVNGERGTTCFASRRSRVTQVYRREGGDWKVVHWHGDEEPKAHDGPRRGFPHPQGAAMPAGHAHLQLLTGNLRHRNLSFGWRQRSVALRAAIRGHARQTAAGGGGRHARWEAAMREVRDRDDPAGPAIRIP
jgi:ketosteroid isomerase-like protein